MTRLLTADPLYNNRLVAQFINRIVRSGKKTLAQRLVYKAFSIISQKGEDPLTVFQKAINNVSPRLEVQARRVGGAAYQVPTEVRGRRKTTLAIRWLVQSAQKRPDKELHTFAEKLAAELLDASKGIGGAVKKRETIHRMAEANRVFAHFRW